ncbi:MAG TPA: HyaD/HybD family hydrogenase maturation endopeptidase [Gemmatimonadales bacterium]|nr:HyaD/HybD family hydrogenase maturation endopeptidase [Gemmatimonadales bacterium]
MTCNPPKTLVVGLGNPLMADDGVGLAALERLREEYDVPPTVALTDGGTWGMMLLPAIEEAEELLLLDAVRTASSPGTLRELGREQLQLYFSHKISPHQIDLKEVLAVADLRGNLPPRLVVIGVEPELVDMRHSLSPCVEIRVGDMVEAAVRQLAEWGHECVPREVTARA